MVSNLRYYSFKKINLGGHVPFAYLLLIPLLFMLISLKPSLVLFTLFSIYGLSGPADWLIQFRKKNAQPVDDSSIDTAKDNKG